MDQQPMKLSHTDIRADEIARKSTLDKVIEFCIELSEFEADKQLQLLREALEENQRMKAEREVKRRLYRDLRAVA